MAHLTPPVRRSAGGILALVVGVAPGATQEPPRAPTPEGAALIGRWRVDLRPTPDAEPYFREMVVESVADGTLQGTFYGSPMREGRINRDWGALRFAFVTSDGSGDYHTAGVLVGPRLEGTTHSLGRGFLAVWRAERAAEPEPEVADGTSSDPGWTQWRGPDRSGIDRGAAWPPDLNAERFRRRWRVELGPGYSGPVADERRVYTTETVDAKTEVVRALDRETGAEVWRAEWPGAMTVPFFAQRNGSWIRSTPALDRGALYVAGMLDVLVCLDAETGRERWRADLADRFELSHESFGFVCSPLVAGDAVYVQANAGVVKLDRRTGATVWRALAEEAGIMGGAFSSPVVATLGGVEQLLVQTRARLCGVDLRSGTVLWSQPVRTFRGMNILTPQPYGDSVFTSAYGGRSHLFAIVAKDGGLAVEEAWTGRAQGYMTSPVVVGRHAYLYLRSKRFTCVDLETGATAWTSPLMGDEYWSLVAQGDRILALTNAGELLEIAADPEGFRIEAQLVVADGETWGHLAIDRGQVFVRELNALAAFDWW